MDVETKKEFQDLKDFLRKHMAGKVDLLDLEDRLRLDMATKVDLERLTVAVDNLTKLTKDYYDEMAVLRHRVEHMEQWIVRVAETTGVKYEA